MKVLPHEDTLVPSASRSTLLGARRDGIGVERWECRFTFLRYYDYYRYDLPLDGRLNFRCGGTAVSVWANASGG